MARIRSVHPDVFMSESISALPATLERTLTRLRNYLDDQGRGVDNVRLIKATIYPLHDEQTSQVLDAELDELARRDMVIRWEVDGRRYICERPEAWDDQQHPQKPSESKCPVPPGYVAANWRPTKDRSHHSSGAVRVDDASAPVPLQEASRSTPPGKERRGEGIGVGEGGEGSTRRAPSASATRPPRLQPIPTGKLPDEWRAWAEENGYGHLDLDRQWTRMLATARERNKRSADWSASWQVWLSNEEPVFADKRLPPSFCGECSSGWLERSDGAMERCPCVEVAS